MRRQFWMGAAAAALMAAAGGGAQAAVVTYVARGVINGGFDETGVFGFSGNDLYGRQVRVVFHRDDDTPSAGFLDDGDQTGLYGFNPAPVTGFVEIAGVRWDLVPSSGSQYQYKQADGCGPGCDAELATLDADSSVSEFDATGRYLTQDVSSLNLSYMGLGDNLLPSRDYHTLPNVYDPHHHLQLTASFLIDTFRFDTVAGEYVGANRAHGGFAVTSLRVFDGPTAAPEPTTWGLMILGFGAAGTMLRRRRVAF